MLPLFVVQAGAAANRRRFQILRRLPGQSRTSIPRVLGFRQEHHGALPDRRPHHGRRDAGSHHLRLHDLRALRYLVQVHHGSGAPPDQHGAARAHRRRRIRPLRTPGDDREAGAAGTPEREAPHLAAGLGRRSGPETRARPAGPGPSACRLSCASARPLPLAWPGSWRCSSNARESISSPWGMQKVAAGCRPIGRVIETPSRRLRATPTKQFDATGAHTIITTSGSCLGAMRSKYPEYAKAPAARVIHATESLARLIEDGKLRLTKPVRRKVTYHDPCYLGRQSEPPLVWKGEYKTTHGCMQYADPPKKINRGVGGVFDEPRRILRAIPGIEFVEMPRIREYAFCCGGGGGVPEAFPELARQTALHRLDEAASVGAECLVDCLSSLPSESVQRAGVFRDAGAPGRRHHRPRVRGRRDRELRRDAVAYQRASADLLRSVLAEGHRQPGFRRHRGVSRAQPDHRCACRAEPRRASGGCGRTATPDASRQRPRLESDLGVVHRGALQGRLRGSEGQRPGGSLVVEADSVDQPAQSRVPDRARRHVW